MATVNKSNDSSSLAEVIDRILDKGVVVDVWARVSGYRGACGNCWGGHLPQVC